MTRISWQTHLDCTQTGPRASLDNAERVLRLEPTLDIGRLWYDEFLECVRVSNSPVREWTDEDDFRLAIYMQREIGMRNISDSTVNKAVRVIARERTRHVVRDWLNTITWDKVERVAHAFEDHWGATPSDRQPTEYIRAASTNFFVGMIARVFKPGCQLDTMVVFEGPQGLKKSSALRILGGDWYGSAHESVQKKDFFEALRGKWIMEISELDAFGHAEVTRVKSVMSTPTDRYRPSYGRASVDFPRQCIFAGTTNKDDWGNDETGLRRFWPIRCYEINLDTLRESRDQLFAEALHLFRAGATWWDMPEATKSVQDDRQHHHPWTQAISDWLVSQTEVTVGEVLANAVKKDLEKAGDRDDRVIGRILTLQGWEKHNVKRNGKQMKVWKRTAETNKEFF